MHYFIFPEFDTTLYQASASRNTGLDEILEIEKTMNQSGGNVRVSRALIKFDLAEISRSMVRGQIATDAKFYLNMYDAKPTELSYSQSLYAYPISGSWVPGEGFRADNPKTQEGATWEFRDGITGKSYWGRAEDTAVSSSGGAWFSSSFASQSFEYETRDMRMNVTPIVSDWLKKEYPNNGFILKRSGSMGNLSSDTPEGSTDRLGNFSFFSRETNTIYPPKLEVEWYDTKFSTGSLDPLTGIDLEDPIVYMKSLRPEYKEKSKVKFRIVGRGRYPTKSYSNTASEYLTAKYFPSASKEQIGGDGAYYSVIDAQTDDVIVPFGSGSAISCDSTGNYFNLWMNGFQSERYYKFEFKVVSDSGTDEETIQYFDEDFVFKVVR
jgi:hypothetical protein|tara:strand:- start:976 stop:2115 length:1140 start_codon:yes stop_codon:yes gene_type:complete